MEISSLKDLYLAELQELASVEKQLAGILPRLAESAANPGLRKALLQHCQEMEKQQKRLGSILEKHGRDTDAHTDQGMQALINETEKMMTMLDGDEVRDAGLIASTQRLKHHEIAGYGIVAALAGQLDFRDDQKRLHDSLEEEKRADVLLTHLAKGEVNRDALAV